MKALIAPNQISTYTWVTSWKFENNEWVADTTQSISGCQRIAEVEEDDNIFEVAAPLYWIECPEDCVPDLWYYKDNTFNEYPKDVMIP